VHVHLSPQDTGQVNGALMTGAQAIATALGGTLNALAAVVVEIAEHLVENGDGSLDIWFSEHGFQCGNAPAADPTVWINGAWGPVASALRALAGFGVEMAPLAVGRKANTPEELAGHRAKLLSKVATE
jgi:hypothetical protein